MSHAYGKLLQNGHCSGGVRGLVCECVHVCRYTCVCAGKRPTSDISLFLIQKWAHHLPSPHCTFASCRKLTGSSLSYNLLGFTSLAHQFRNFLTRVCLFCKFTFFSPKNKVKMIHHKCHLLQGWVPSSCSSAGCWCPGGPPKQVGPNSFMKHLLSAWDQPEMVSAEWGALQAFCLLRDTSVDCVCFAVRKEKKTQTSDII